MKKKDHENCKAWVPSEGVMIVSPFYGDWIMDISLKIQVNSINNSVVDKIRKDYIWNFQWDLGLLAPLVIVSESEHDTRDEYGGDCGVESCESRKFADLLTLWQRGQLIF